MSPYFDMKPYNFLWKEYQIYYQDLQWWIKGQTIRTYGFLRLVNWSNISKVLAVESLIFISPLTGYRISALCGGCNGTNSSYEANYKVIIGNTYGYYTWLLSLECQLYVHINYIAALRELIDMLKILFRFCNKF